MKKVFAFTAAAILAAGSASAFTIVTEPATGADSTANTSYDYSTYVSTNPTPITIGPAPSAAGTRGLRFDVNTTTASVDSVVAYPDLTGLNLAAGNFTLTFDVFPHHNGDAGGATGSTEFFVFGSAVNTTGAAVVAGNMIADGFFYALTGDAGAAQDARYYSGTVSPLTRDDAAPNWWGANELDYTGAGWAGFYPNAGPNPPAATVALGAPGKQWTTVRLEVTGGGANRVVSLKRPADPTFTVVSTITTGVGSSARPFVGLTDLFTSVANPGADQFTVFDNIVISDGTNTVTYNFEPASADDWQLYAF